MLYHRSPDLMTHATILESAVAPMFGYDLICDLSSLMLGVGIPLSLLTVASWQMLFA